MIKTLESKLNEAFSYLEKYGKQIHRKHVAQYGFTMYEHPTFSTAVIMVKDGKIVGQANKVKMLSDNSITREKLETADFLKFTF